MCSLTCVYAGPYVCVTEARKCVLLKPLKCVTEAPKFTIMQYDVE